MLYTLKLYCVVCRLYLSKTKVKKKVWPIMRKNEQKLFEETETLDLNQLS